MTVDLDGVYVRSPDVVSREIEGELVIVPVVAGIGDMDDEIYTMNDTGKAIWNGLDGTLTLRSLAASLAGTFDGAEGEIERDVRGLVDELVGRRMVVAVDRDS